MEKTNPSIETACQQWHLESKSIFEIFVDFGFEFEKSKKIGGIVIRFMREE